MFLPIAAALGGASDGQHLEIPESLSGFLHNFENSAESVKAFPTMLLDDGGVSGWAGPPPLH